MAAHNVTHDATTSMQHDEKFRFVSISALNKPRNSKAQRQARSHAVKQGLEKKRKRQLDTQSNFHIIRGSSMANTTSYYLGSKGGSDAVPTSSPSSADAVNPVHQTLAVDSSRLRVLLDDYRARQAPEPVFSVAKPFAFQSVQAVFRQGLVDPTLVNAVMLAMLSTVTGEYVANEVLGYQYKAIRGIRERMSRMNEATSESTIGAILLLAGIEARLGRRDQVQLHMRAVQQLLNLCKDRGIYLTVGIKRAIFWQDLNACILAGTPRLFTHTTFAELHWVRDAFSPSFYRLPPGFEQRRENFSSEFIDILEDLHALQCIRNIPGAKSGDPLMMAYINNHTASIQSRLGFLSESGTWTRSCRLAAYICSVMLCCTVWCGLFIPSHISKELLEELQQTRDEGVWGENLDLLLWLTCIGGAFGDEGRTREGYVDILAEIEKRSIGGSPKKWSNVECILQQFIWSEAAFRGPVEALIRSRSWLV